MGKCKVLMGSVVKGSPQKMRTYITHISTNLRNFCLIVFSYCALSIHTQTYSLQHRKQYPPLPLCCVIKHELCVSSCVSSMAVAVITRHVLCCVYQRLVRLCGEVRASPAETDEVLFLCTLCAKLKDDPYLINFFVEVEQSTWRLVVVSQ